MNIEEQYLDLMKDVLNNGTEKEDRTGTGTIGLFGKQLKHNMSEGFPLLTTKKMGLKTITTELLWFLKGDTNIKYLVDNNCNIWNGDAYKNYLNTYNLSSNSISYKDNIVTNGPCDMNEFIHKIRTDKWFSSVHGGLGPIYGSQWRNWGRNGYPEYDKYNRDNKGIDQFKNISEALINNPDSRRIMVNAWNVSNLDTMVLPPCHYGFQIYTEKMSDIERYPYWFALNFETGMEYNENNTPNYDDEYYTSTPERRISLMWNQRSCDLPLGIPFNIASYGLLLTILGKQFNMVPHDLIANLGDCHIYKNQIDGVKEQLTRSVKKFPRIALHKEKIDLNYDLSYNDFELVNYEPLSRINFPLSN